MKIDIPEEQFNRFQQTVADSTFWNEAELNPRQIKHIVACLAPEVAEWAREKALQDAATEAARSGQEWLDLWQPNAKLPEVWDFIASDILDLDKEKTP